MAKYALGKIGSLLLSIRRLRGVPGRLPGQKTRACPDWLRSCCMPRRSRGGEKRESFVDRWAGRFAVAESTADDQRMAALKSRSGYGGGCITCQCDQMAAALPFASRRASIRKSGSSKTCCPRPFSGRGPGIQIADALDLAGTPVARGRGGSGTGRWKRQQVQPALVQPI